RPPSSSMSRSIGSRGSRGSCGALGCVTAAIALRLSCGHACGSTTAVPPLQATVNYGRAGWRIHLMPTRTLTAESRLLNRELSWVEFNARVLDLAADE